MVLVLCLHLHRIGVCGSSGYTNTLPRSVCLHRSSVSLSLGCLPDAKQGVSVVQALTHDAAPATALLSVCRPDVAGRRAYCVLAADAAGRLFSIAAGRVAHVLTLPFAVRAVRRAEIDFCLLTRRRCAEGFSHVLGPRPLRSVTPALTLHRRTCLSRWCWRAMPASCLCWLRTG
jgi:hypothetical protein